MLAMGASDIGAGVLLALGCVLALTGSVGLWRMPDFYTRLHPSGKSDTLAQAFILGGLIVYTDDPLVMAKLALLSMLLFITAPTATHAVTKGAHLDGIKPVLGEGVEDTEDKQS